jgi:probable addiction module antidote protein
VKKSRSARSRQPASRSHEDATVESFRHDPKFAAEYLDAILADGDQEEILMALRYMAKAFGGVRGLANGTNLNATSLYRTLSTSGNPELRSLRSVLAMMGLRLSVRPILNVQRSR